MLAGAGVSLAVRALWGLELDVWQYVGIAGLWLALRRCRPRPGIETAALGGLAMMPRVFAALAGQVPLDILLSLAAVPLGMLGAAFFLQRDGRHGLHPARPPAHGSAPAWRRWDCCW